MCSFQAHSKGWCLISMSSSSHVIIVAVVWCRQDNNLLHDLFVEPSSRAGICYHNRPKSCLYSIMQNPEIILRGAKHRVSEVPQMSSQLFHKILLIRTILTV